MPIARARAAVSSPDLSEFAEAGDPLVGRVKEALRRKKSYRVETLADKLDVAPKRVREAVQALRDAGYRIPDEAAGVIELAKVDPSRAGDLHKLPLTLLDGDRIKFGVVSDTHLCSKECALDELHLAYDYFEREGITTVLHGGDLVAGMGIFPLQHLYITHHSFEDQRDFSVANYPRRDGITTHIIGGNHDLEGDFGKAGCDPVSAFADRRDDVNYLGAYSAWLELANGAYVHMLHGKGGVGYALSYKMQKIIESYPPGRKPAALILGHYHRQSTMDVRGVQGMYPACFEWRSKQFGERVGHSNNVGFHIVDATLGDDGSIVGWRPEWLPLWEGRTI